MHKWTKDDDIVAFYLYKNGTKNIGYSIEDMGVVLGISPSSLKMRIGNFQWLDGHGGLSHSAKQSKDIFEEYKGFDEFVLCSIVKKICKIF